MKKPEEKSKKPLSEESVSRGENMHEVIMDNMNALVYVSDMETYELLFLNKMGREIFGKSYKGKKCFEVLQVNQKKPCSFCTNHLIVDKSGNPTDVYKWEFQNTKTDLWFECRDSAIPWSNGKNVRMEVATEITARKKIEEELKRTNENLEQLVVERTKELEASELKYRTIADFTFDLETWIDPDGNYVYISPSCESITGYKASEFIAKPDLFTEIAHPSDKKFVKKHFGNAGKHSPDAEIYEFRIITKSGETRWIGHVCSPVITAEGEFLGRRGSNRDITENKNYEQELVRNKKILEETGRLARVGGWEVDLVNETHFLSDINKEIHEVEPDFIPDMATAINFYTPEFRPVISKCVEDAIEKGESFDLELQILTAKHNKLWVRAVGEPIEENGKVVKLIGVFQDINSAKLLSLELEKHRKNLEKLVEERTASLNNAVENLKRSNLELENFAYVASHDLQEPLRMVASYTQLLEKRYKDQLDQDAKDFINYAVDGANRMQILINDLLDYSRVTTRGKSLVKIDLTSVLGQAIANLKQKIQETGTLIVNDDLPYVYGDENQLVRVFQNLIDNGIKFSDKENPRISIVSKVKDDKVQVSIKDNGIGIDKIYSERIFTMFQRLHNKKDYPGTGIGLAICKRTIERHGGKIWFDSEIDQGTTFHITLKNKI